MIEWKANMISEPPLSDTPTMTELAKTFPRRVLQPALIARYRGVADIADAVMVARDKKFEVGARAGSHNVAGRPTTDCGMMIDVSMFL